MSDLSDPECALFSISVAADLTGVSAQALRGYENKGLLDPYRTEGGTRRYSTDDVDRINQISTLLAAGVNLAGIGHILALQAERDRLRSELDEATSDPTSEER